MEFGKGTAEKQSKRLFGLRRIKLLCRQLYRAHAFRKTKELANLARKPALRDELQMCGVADGRDPNQTVLRIGLHRQSRRHPLQRVRFLCLTGPIEGIE